MSGAVNLFTLCGLTLLLEFLRFAFEGLHFTIGDTEQLVIFSDVSEKRDLPLL